MGLNVKLQLERCTRCPAEVPPGEDLCGPCREDHRARCRKAMRAARARRRAAGQCLYCRRPSDVVRCAACKIAQGRVPKPTTGDYPGDYPAQDKFRADANGWKRYRGRGRKGPPSIAAQDEHDLAAAAAQLERGREAARYARSAAVTALPRIQRVAAHSAAADELALAARLAGEVVDRLRGAAEAPPDDADAGWTYPRDSAATIAAAAKPGTMVYAPPPETHRAESDHLETELARARRRPPAPPDLAPLRAALAARGLKLVDDGAFWWRVVAG